MIDDTHDLRLDNFDTNETGTAAKNIKNTSEWPFSHIAPQPLAFRILYRARDGRSGRQGTNKQRAPPPAVHVRTGLIYGCEFMIRVHDPS